MVRVMMRTTLLAIVLSLVSANAHADIWTWWYLPHVTIGGGYISTLVIRDSQGIPGRPVYVYFYKDDGTALNLNVYGNVEGKSMGNQIPQFNFTLGPNQERSYALTSTGNLTSGSIQIGSYGIGDLNASLRYTATDGQGNATDVVGILPVQPNWSWTTPVQKTSSGDMTGVAIANPWGDEQITVSFDFFQNGNRVPNTGTQIYTLNVLGHKALFVSDIWGSMVWNNFSGVGTLRISSVTDTFVAVALRADVSGASGWQFSSLPAEANAQQWTCSYTDSSGPETVTWNWRFYDGFTFTGFEQNWNTNGVPLRGYYDAIDGDFRAEWYYYNSTTDRGDVIFLGRIQADNKTITGQRISLKEDGTVNTNYAFTATRVY